MLKKELQQEHFAAVWASMLRHLKAFYAAQKPEELHQFRVQVKKINALLFFLQDLKSGKAGAGALQPLRALYKHAGQIRNAHIQLELFAKYQMGNEALKSAQEKSTNLETKRFCSKRGTALRQLERLYQTLAGDFHDVKNKVIRRLYKKRLKKSGRFFARQDGQADKLHQNRKKIKMLLYLQEALPASMVKKLRLDTRYLDELQHAIGKWNDTIMILELLKTGGFADIKNLEKLEKRSRRKRADIRSLSKIFRKRIE